MPNKYLDSDGLAEYTSLVKTALNAKAPLNSPALTGTPTAPTASAGTDTTQIATTEFVQDAIDSEETRADGAYVPLAGGTITGNLSVNGTITGNVTGNASTATNATNDANGNPIASTYLPLAGGTLTGAVNGVTPTAGDESTKLATTAYVREEVRQHSGIPIGHIYFSVNPNIPQGSLPLFGGEFSRDTYSDLWAWVQQQAGYCKTEAEWQALATNNNNNVPYYSDGDGSTTFRVPSLRCWVKGADGTVVEVGNYLEAGLPDIDGFFTIQKMEDGGNAILNTNGAISTTVDGSRSWGIDWKPKTGVPTQKILFNASRSNSIYGSSATVQPESIVGMWLVKAYGTIVDTGQIDEQQYIDDRMNAMTQYVDDEVETGVPTGCVQAFAGQTTPTGWLLCDGSAVSRVTYAKLFSVIGTSYGVGDGSTTFNLPNLIDKFVEGSATSGTAKSAGLPNVVYEFGLRKGELSNGGFTSIAFANTSITISEVTSASGSVKIGNTSPTYDKVKLDSSLYNSIYGNSNTVQPPALTMRYIIKY